MKRNHDDGQAGVNAAESGVRKQLRRVGDSFGTFFRDIRRYLKDEFSAENRVFLLVLALLIILGIFVRLRFINHPIRYDEAISLRFSRLDLATIASQYLQTNNHVLHSMLVHLTIPICGQGLWAIRLPALIPGILLIPATYVVGSIFYNRHAGLLSAALVAVSSILVEYSDLSRGYSLLILFFLLLLGLGAYVLRTNNAVAWICFSIVGALGFYTIPVMLYPMGMVVVWLFLSSFTAGKKWPGGRF